MQLKKQPETEREYWLAIEGIGGFVWRMDHDIADDRIQVTAAQHQELESTRQLVARLADEACAKFGIIHIRDYPERPNFSDPLPPAPEGKRYYWDWYKDQKRSFLEEEYKKCICTGCPFSQGVEEFISSGHHPCGVMSFSGGGNFPLHKCVMTDLFRDWTREQLLAEIKSKGGNEAVTAFLAKEQELKKTNIST